MISSRVNMSAGAGNNADCGADGAADCGADGAADCGADGASDIIYIKHIKYNFSILIKE